MFEFEHIPKSSIFLLCLPYGHSRRTCTFVARMMWIKSRIPHQICIDIFMCIRISNFWRKGRFLCGTWNNTFSHSPHCVRHRPTALNPFACRCAGMCLRTHSHYFPKWMCRAIQLYIRFSMPYTLNLNVPFKFAAWNLGTLLLLFISESLQCTTSSSLFSVEYAVLSNHRNACTGERERMEIRMKLLRIQWGTSNLQGFHIPLHSCTQRNCAAATQKTVANRSVSVGWSNNARLNATAISPSIIHMTNNKYASIVM